MMKKTIKLLITFTIILNLILADTCTEHTTFTDCSNDSSCTFNVSSTSCTNNCTNLSLQQCTQNPTQCQTGACVPNACSGDTQAACENASGCVYTSSKAASCSSKRNCMLIYSTSECIVSCQWTSQCKEKSYCSVNGSSDGCNDDTYCSFHASTGPTCINSVSQSQCSSQTSQNGCTNTTGCKWDTSLCSNQPSFTCKSTDLADYCTSSDKFCSYSVTGVCQFPNTTEINPNSSSSADLAQQYSILLCFILSYIF